MNDSTAFAESWVVAVKGECVNHFLCFGLDHLHYIGQSYVLFHNHDRPHQGLGNQVPAPRDGPSPLSGLSNATPPTVVGCRQRLGGLLKSYYARAA